MGFEKTEKQAPSAVHSGDQWSNLAAAAYQPGQKLTGSKGASSGAVQEAAFSRLQDCNPALPPISHDQYLKELGMQPGQKAPFVLTPPDNFKSEQPFGKYSERDHPWVKPHKILQPCEGEPLIS